MDEIRQAIAQQLASVPDALREGLVESFALRLAKLMDEMELWQHYAAGKVDDALHARDARTTSPTSPS